MKSHSIRVATALGWGLLAMGPVCWAQIPGVNQPETAQDRKNIAVLQGFWREVHEGHNGAAVPKYLVAGYIEHNNKSINGSAHMAQVFGHMPAGFRMKTVSQTVYASDTFALLYQHRLIPVAAHPGQTQNIDMIECFKVADGLLQEHWMFFAGSAPVAGQPQTEQEKKNIALVESFWHDVVEARNASAVPQYISEEYTESGAGRANGREPLAQSLGQPLAAGESAVRVVSQTAYARGAFVILRQDRAVSDSSQAGKSTTQHDVLEMFQVDNGQILQHWTFFGRETGTSPSWGF